MTSIATLPDLPVVQVLPALLAALDQWPNAVLVAPPGAGKTTLVPLALLGAGWRGGKKIIVLEPRRLAARAAATRMASLLGEKVGDRVGYRVRFDTRVSNKTIIEVVTEGVFMRMLADDPGLEQCAAILFDEFHERSLDGDLALALCLDLQTGLREDLRLLPMSATLDGAAVAKLLEAPVIESEGRQYPVKIMYEERPPREPIEVTMARSIVQHVQRETSGSVLAFLPGQREIERIFATLSEKLPTDIELHRLYGAISQTEQDAAISPSPEGARKVVLSSAIAETSLTIDGVTTVIDSGLSREPVFEPATGLLRLQTVRASKAAVDQRAGRAGRLGPGQAIRLWRKEQTAALPAYAPPEIMNADLSALLLDLADWGVTDPRTLQWLDEPPATALAEARALLESFGALGANGLTLHGKAMRKLPLPPRFSHMVVTAAEQGAAYDAVLLALVLQERGAGGRSTDLVQRLTGLKRAKDGRSKKLTSLARSIASNGEGGRRKAEISAGVLLGFAYPDRIAQRSGSARSGAIRYRLANGRGAELDATEGLANAPFLVVADMAGRAGAARILAAAEISKAEILEHFAEHIETKTSNAFDKSSRQLICESATFLGALQLDKPKRSKPDAATAEAALLDAVRQHGLNILPWQDSNRSLRGKLAFLHHHQPNQWPAVDDESLLEDLDNWLGPYLAGQVSLAGLGAGQLGDAMALRSSVGHSIASLLPAHFDAPSGSRLPIDYEAEKAVLRARPQELFGLATHPSIMNGTVPLEIELLSPAGRPIQITRDLTGFWQGSWRDVRADLRGRYPKHPWPENPLEAVATNRVKPRK